MTAARFTRTVREPSSQEGSSVSATGRGRATPRYLILHKPYGMVSQFTPEGSHPGLGSLGHFPRDVYAAGRLDADSEGLLLLTNDGRVIHRLTDPRFGHERTYLAQLEGIPDEHALGALRRGLAIKGQLTRQARVALLQAEPPVGPRSAPIRARAKIPTSWIEIILTEGRNRQVRRMTAAVGHPTLRLIRTAIGVLSLSGLAPGEHRMLSAAERDALLESLKIAQGPRARRPSGARPKKK